MSSINGLWAITSYYNPNRYATKYQNYLLFERALRNSGVSLLTIECVFGNEPFTLAASGPILQVRANDVMWQKERLLNVAIRELPLDCTKVVWLDADVLFENPSWAHETAALLEQKPIAQPFEQVIRLPKDQQKYCSEGETWDSFAASIVRDPDSILSGDFSRHGHTGFAWAARREIITRHGLYDACISGSGDHMMAHAFAGDWESACLDRILGRNTAHKDHFVRWAKAIYPEVRARIGYTSGRLLHLWHGDQTNRRYVIRNQELAAFGFDPDLDIRIGTDGCWEWSSNRSELHQWAIDYYQARKEDG